MWCLSVCVLCCEVSWRDSHLPFEWKKKLFIFTHHHIYFIQIGVGKYTCTILITLICLNNASKTSTEKNHHQYKGIIKQKLCSHKCAMKSVLLQNRHTSIKKSSNNEWFIFIYKPVFYLCYIPVKKKNHFFAICLHNHVNISSFRLKKKPCIINYTLHSHCTEATFQIDL